MTTGEEIAKDFSESKCHLYPAEQRRLAVMIDYEFARKIEELESRRVADAFVELVE